MVQGATSRMTTSARSLHHGECRVGSSGRTLASMAHSEPSTWPCGVRQRHAEIGGDAELGRRRDCVPTTGWPRASSTTISGSPLVTTCWQNEWLSGVCRAAGPGFRQPGTALEELPVGVDQRHQRHGGTDSTRLTRLVTRSKDSRRGNPAGPLQSGLRAVQQLKVLIPAKKYSAASTRLFVPRSHPAASGSAGGSISLR